MSIEEELQEPLLERLSATPEPGNRSTKPQPQKPPKRKREADLPESKKTAKKPKNKKKRAIDEDDDELDIEAGINKAFSHMDSNLLADYIAQRTRKYESELSSIELEDRCLPAIAIQDTTAWDKPRTLENLPDFLEKFAGNSKKLSSSNQKNGSPHTIIITAAGLRAASIARAVRKFQTKDAIIAKLFAKHIKLKESVAFLKSKRTGIAVGTPTRLKDLMGDGALATDSLERIVVDTSHIDLKKRGILETKETQVALTLLLGQAGFRESCSESIGIECVEVSYF